MHHNPATCILIIDRASELRWFAAVCLCILSDLFINDDIFCVCIGVLQRGLGDQAITKYQTAYILESVVLLSVPLDSHSPLS